jgi:hypothetical protein
MKVGDFYPVWWDTGLPKQGNYYPGRIREIHSYHGKYPEFFTHVIYVETPRSMRGHPLAIKVTEKENDARAALEGKL